MQALRERIATIPVLSAKESYAIKQPSIEGHKKNKTEKPVEIPGIYTLDDRRFCEKLDGFEKAEQCFISSYHTKYH